MRKGLAKAKAEGVHIGRPLMVDQNEIRKLRSDGLSHRAIAKKLNCSYGSVAYALKPR